MYYAYVIRSDKDGRLYKGVSQNTVVRLEQHNSGKTRSTKGYRPWKLVYREEFKTFEKARARELYFKSGEGREFLNKTIRPCGATE